MKKLFLLCLTALFLHSCSGGDDSTPISDDTGPEIPETGILVKTILTNHNDDHEEKTKVTEYENGRPIKVTNYTEDGELESYVLITYTPEGWEKTSTIYNPDDTQRNIITYFYDDLGRIYNCVQVGTWDVEMNYTFNDDGTITGTTSAFTSSKTFLLDEEGYPYKEIESDGGFLEYTLDAFHMPVSAEESTVIGESVTTGNRTYQYDATHNPQLLGLANIHGDYKPNYTLKTMYIPEEDMITANKYITKITRNWGNTTNVSEYVYEFNPDGLPVKRERFVNDVFYSTTEYFYE